jgi:hypothetical protein
LQVINLNEIVFELGMKKGWREKRKLACRFEHYGFILPFPKILKNVIINLRIFLNL